MARPRKNVTGKSTRRPARAKARATRRKPAARAGKLAAKKVAPVTTAAPADEGAGGGPAKPET
jgi:hypothetical protein